jgi:hypothetical protein
MCVNFGDGTGKGNTLTGSAANGGASFSFGNTTGGWFKMLNLPTLTDGGIAALGNSDNGVSDGVSNMTGVTVLGSTTTGGASCQLP